MASKSDEVTIELQLHIVHETEEIVKVADFEERTAWLVKSLIKIERRSKAGGALITLPEWLAEQKGLI